MKLIESKVEIIEQQHGLEGVHKQIELAGRTCYKSEDKITEDSAKRFVDRMIKSGHGAMLEHGTIYLLYIAKLDRDGIHEVPEDFPDSQLVRNPYSKVHYVDMQDGTVNICITTNLRVMVEYGILDSLKYLCEPTEQHEKRITARFTCDMGVGREITRHRTIK